MATHEPTDLELSLRRVDATHYRVEMLVTQPDSEAPVTPLGQELVTAQFDEAALLAAWSDGGPDTYGRALGERLFGAKAAAVALAATRAEAASDGRALRLRLVCAADSPELHALRWETLVVPGESVPLALSERVLLTRTVGSADWQPVVLRAKAELRALLVVAAPADLPSYQLAAIDAEAEVAQAREHLRGIATTTLAAPGEATLNRIVAQLRDGYDILYLVAHGAQVQGEPWVFLDDGEHRAARVAGKALVDRLADLPTRPRLILLASCESAGDGTASTLAALGPRLATAGVPAVIAMQGRFAITTNQTFVPAFIRELQRDGRIDRALAAARQEVADQADWWMPALFTRLRSGRIWYEPGFDEQDFGKWPTLVRSIVRGKCTPILGPGLLDPLLGTTRDLAQRLAAKHRFPLASNERDHLPQVAQYLAVQQDIDFLRDEIEQALRARLSLIDAAPAGASLDEALTAVGAARRSAAADDPHQILARLPLPIFLTGNSDRLLADALEEEGKRPQLRICPWNRHSERDAMGQDEILKPAKETPLVYHLFGRLDDPETLVLTEDDYFRYLIGVTRNEDLFPKEVGSALVNSALLFLGFRLEDWNFRVLFQSIMNLAGSELRRRHTHVAVQIDPQEDTMLDPRAAREYLKMYFGPASALQFQTNISIYWGKAEDFLRELYPRIVSELEAQPAGQR